MYDVIVQDPTSSPTLDHLPIWLDHRFMATAAAVQGLRPLHLCVVKGDVPVALMPVYERRRLGKPSLGNALASYYQGLHILEHNANPARDGLNTLEICSAIASKLCQSYRNVSINMLPQNTDIRGFTWNKLKATPLYTYTHDLHSPLTPLRDEKQKLKRAAERGYTFVELADPDTFTRMATAMYSRKDHITGFQPAKLKIFIHDLLSMGLMKQFCVLRDDRIISTNIVLSDSPRAAYTILRASDPEELKHGVSTWHTMQLIETLSEQYQCLDFCGANAPSVARFKAALGLELKLFFRIHT